MLGFVRDAMGMCLAVREEVEFEVNIIIFKIKIQKSINFIKLKNRMFVIFE